LIDIEAGQREFDKLIGSIPNDLGKKATAVAEAAAPVAAAVMATLATDDQQELYRPSSDADTVPEPPIKRVKNSDWT
jgi:hypothetical protein